MRRVLLSVTLATLMLIGGTASAGGTGSCGAALGVHNNTTCTATQSLTMDGTATLSVSVGIGALEGVFNGDVQVTLSNNADPTAATAFIQKTCAYRATNGFAGTCLDSANGQFQSGEAVFCVGKASGIGQWSVTCSIA